MILAQKSPPKGQTLRIMILIKKECMECYLGREYYCFRSRKVRQPSSSKVGDRLPDYFLDISVYTPDWLSKKVLNNTHQ